MKKTLLIVAIVVLALAALGVGVVFAQGGYPPSNYGYGRGMMGNYYGNGGYGMMGGRGGYGMMGGQGGYGPMHDYVEEALADKLGLTEEQVEQELTTKPMYQIALDHGVKQEDLQAFMTDVHKTAFAAAVKAGVMTQEQADFMLQRMSQNGYGTGNCPMGGGFGGGRWQNQAPQYQNQQ